MSDFKKQIQEDIKEYQELYPYISNICKPEWAFNFWVLDKLYSEDVDVIEDKIVDYNDKGIDCYVWHEEKKELCLIQNKYYGNDTILPLDYITNDFLTRAVTALENGTYTRSQELQDIYTKYSSDPNFSVTLALYVTNNKCCTDGILNAIKNFNSTHPKQNATIYGLDDIEKLYYDDPNIDTANMSFILQTVNKGTTLNVNSQNVSGQSIDSLYMMVPVYNIYELLQEANRVSYPVFASNIREYLGPTGKVNKKIMETLKDSEDRNNFFYYNNGITIIVKDKKILDQCNNMRPVKVVNPQIVNGCQTASTINEVLSGWPVSTAESDFSNTFVMVKLLAIPDNTAKMEVLRKKIVTNNNSQNKIDQKNFEANNEEFRRIQVEFEDKGFLVCIKQSDKRKFTKVTYKTASKLLSRNFKYIDKFGLSSLSKPADFVIDLARFLQVVLAFSTNAHNAVQNKSELLVAGTSQNNTVTDFIRNNNVTINDLVSLWCLYLRAEQERKNSHDKKTPNSLYLVHCVGHYECNGDWSKISEVLSDKSAIDRLVKLYTGAFTVYLKSWNKANDNKGYNAMCKSPINYDMLDTARDLSLSII